MSEQTKQDLKEQLKVVGLKILLVVGESIVDTLKHNLQDSGKTKSRDLIKEEKNRITGVK